MEGAKFHRASGPSYTSLPATTKLDHLWSNCLRGSSEPAAPATPAEMLSWFMDPVAATMAGEGDELEEGRVKAIHRQGAVARVEWRDLGGHPYTGLLQVLLSPLLCRAASMLSFDGPLVSHPPLTPSRPCQESRLN